MKRILQVLIITSLCSITVGQLYGQALDYHWIGLGTDNYWSNPDNWETKPAGTSDIYTLATNPPSDIDNVIIDDLSFPFNPPRIEIDVNDAKCANFTYAVSTTPTPVFIGNASSKLIIYGSLTFSGNIDNQFVGTYEFKGSGGNIAGNFFAGGDLIFDTSGSIWVLTSALKANNISILNGTLQSYSYQINVGGNWIVANSGNFNSGTGKVVFDGTGSVEIIVPSNVKAFNNLEIDKLNGNVNINSEPTNPRIAFKIGNDLNIKNGSLYDWGNQISNDGSGATKLLSLGAGTSLLIGDDVVGTAATIFPTGFATNLNLTSTVDYRDRTTPQLVSAVPEYGNLNFSNAGGILRTKSVTHSTAASTSPYIPLTVRGDILIDQSIKVEDNGYQITGVTGKTFKMSGNAELVIGKNTIPTRFPLNFLDNNIDLSPQSTVTYNSSAAQTVKGIVGVGYGNLTISGNSIKTLDATTVIQGNLTISASNTLDVTVNNYNISIQGNWIGTGSFTAQAGTVTFNGTTNQNLTAAATNHQFYNIRMSTGNAGTAGLTLLSKVNITNTVFFDSGLIRSSINNELAFPEYPGSTSPVLNAKDQSHVVGPVIKVGNDDFIFPIGDGTLYRPSGITGVANNGNFRARYFNQSPNSIAAPLGPATTTSTSNVIPPNPNSIQQPLAGKVDEYEYWTLESLSGPKNAKPYLSWDERSIPANVRNGYFPSKELMVVALWNEGTRKWDNKGGVNQAGNLSKGNVTATEAVNAANLTVFTLSTVFNALPIELLYFKASLINNAVQFSWATAKEVNNDFFTVEKSADGVNFETLLQIKGAGNSQETRKYTASDVNPYSGVTYYRLKQTDVDGKFDYSKTEAVHTRSAGASLLAYSPENKQIRISYTLPITQKGVLTIHNSKGVQLWSKSVSGNQAGTVQTITLPVSSHGWYVVSLQLENQVITKKLIVP